MRVGLGAQPPVNVIGVLIEHMTFGLVDNIDPGMRQHDVRFAIQNVDALLQEGRFVKVIMRRPLKVSAGVGHFQRAVEVRIGANIGLVPEIVNALVLLGEPPADVAGLVGRAVIGNKNLEIIERLSQQRLNHLREACGCTVVNRNSDP